MIEKELENDLVARLTKLGYSEAKINKDNINENLRTQLSLLNKSTLNGRELTASEVKSILNILESDSSAYENYRYHFRLR